MGLVGLGLVEIPLILVQTGGKNIYIFIIPLPIFFISSQHYNRRSSFSGQKIGLLVLVLATYVDKV